MIALSKEWPPAALQKRLTEAEDKLAKADGPIERRQAEDEARAVIDEMAKAALVAAPARSLLELQS